MSTMGFWKLTILRVLGGGLVDCRWEGWCSGGTNIQQGVAPNTKEGMVLVFLPGCEITKVHHNHDGRHQD